MEAARLADPEPYRDRFRTILLAEDRKPQAEALMALAAAPESAELQDSGDYSVEHLIPDLYNIKVTYQGFETYEAKGIQINADTSPKVDVKLTVGGAATTVEVNADTIPVLKTDRADVSPS